MTIFALALSQLELSRTLSAATPKRNLADKTRKNSKKCQSCSGYHPLLYVLCFSFTYLLCIWFAISLSDLFWLFWIQLVLYQWKAKLKTKTKEIREIRKKCGKIKIPLMLKSTGNSIWNSPSVKAKKNAGESNKNASHAGKFKII